MHDTESRRGLEQGRAHLGRLQQRRLELENSAEWVPEFVLRVTAVESGSETVDCFPPHNHISYSFMCDPGCPRQSFRTKNPASVARTSVIQQRSTYVRFRCSLFSFT